MTRRTKRTKKRRSRRKKALVSLFGLAGMAKAFLFPFDGKWERTTMEVIKQGDIEAYVKRVFAGLTGIDPWSGQFKFEHLKEGLIPLLGAGIASKVARKFGLNKCIKHSTMGLMEV